MIETMKLQDKATETVTTWTTESEFVNGRDNADGTVHRVFDTAGKVYITGRLNVNELVLWIHENGLMVVPGSAGVKVETPEYDDGSAEYDDFVTRNSTI